MFRKTGSDLIDSTLGKFEQIAADLEAGVGHNEQTIATNNGTIQGLIATNAELAAANDRGRTVAQRIRDLIGD